MKLYFTDERANKRLIVESDDLNEVYEAADADARSKFIFLKRIKIKSREPEIYTFVDTQEQEVGYSIEE